MPVTARQLVIRISNPDILHETVQHLRYILEEMNTVNPRNTPIKGSTKDRWAEAVQEAVNYFGQFIPKDEVSSDESS